jgi:hypothetical protein
VTTVLVILERQGHGLTVLAIPDHVAIIASGLAMGKPNPALNGPELRTSKPAASPTTAASSK